MQKRYSLQNINHRLFINRISPKYEVMQLANIYPHKGLCSCIYSSCAFEFPDRNINKLDSVPIAQFIKVLEIVCIVADNTDPCHRVLDQGPRKHQ